MSKQKKALNDLSQLKNWGVDKKQQSHQNQSSQRKSISANDLPNLGWLFYRGYYNDLDFRKLSTKLGKKGYQQELNRKNNAFYNKSFAVYRGAQLQGKDHPRLTDLLKVAGSNGFSLTTTYPGLIIGTGYNHESGFEGELKLGFYFDYTTGLPVIPGSTVKGKLRSVFPNAHKNPEDEQQRTKYIQYQLFEVFQELDNKSVDFSPNQVDRLEEEIFTGDTGEVENEEKQYLPMSKRDFFFEAFIEKSVHQSPNGAKSKGHFLANDFITPHKHAGGKTELDPFSNPVPLQFLKLLPRVVFHFQFKFQTTTIDEYELTPVHKELLFKKILLDIGIGAKTNVGYGQFSSDK